MAAKKKCKVFVSYSRHDEALVRPLAALLGVAADAAVFLDVTSLKPGELWEEETFNALKQASVFVLCWCCESFKSVNVAKEIAAALSGGNKTLIPVLFCGMPLPLEFGKRQWTDLRGKVVHDCGAHPEITSARKGGGNEPTVPHAEMRANLGPSISREMLELARRMGAARSSALEEPSHGSQEKHPEVVSPSPSDPKFETVDPRPEANELPKRTPPVMEPAFKGGIFPQRDRRDENIVTKPSRENLDDDYVERELIAHRAKQYFEGLATK